MSKHKKRLQPAAQGHTDTPGADGMAAIPMPPETLASPTPQPESEPEPAAQVARAIEHEDQSQTPNLKSDNPQSPSEPAPRSPFRRLMEAVPGGSWLAARRLQIPSTSFWVLFLLILVAGGILRTWRMDMPPFDFPADRQHTNAATIELLRQGEPLLNFRNPFMELRLYPWITARTSFLCKLFHCQIWTLARFWSAVFGMVTILMAACAGYWAAGTPGAAPARRRRIALFWMAAIAFNPYHRLVSHMISTESFTLAMQMCAVAFFWIAYRHPRNIFYFFTFIAFFILSGWAKIPSLIWLPGFFIYFLAHPATRGRAGRASLIGLALFFFGTLAVFWIYKINPFKIAREYEKNYPYFAQHMQLWIGSTLWTKAYLGRIALMLTLPGVLLALMGLLAAPWLFRITTAVFLALFYCLVNLNTYNFCHIIIPGTALAAWGANALVEAASGESTASLLGDWGGRHERWQKCLNEAAGLALALFLVFWLYPKGPDAIPDPRPRGEIIKAMDVIGKLVPKGTWVYHDDGENSLSYMNNQEDNSCAPDKLDLRTGYYYLFERFSDRPLNYAGSGWVKWASLPGEPGGILFSRPPADPTPAEKSKFTPVAWPRPIQQPAPTTQTQPQASPLLAETCLMPQGPYDAARQTLIVHPGSSVTFGITWDNPRNYPLAGMLWRSERWGRPVAVPLREGGFAISHGGVLCIPVGNQPTAYYTFEIPQGFPPGTYTAEYYPLSPGLWRDPDQDAAPLPFRIVCDSGAVPPEVIDLPFRALYPAQYNAPPLLWPDRWLFRAMGFAPEGYSFNGTVQNYFLSCPMRPAGVYELTVRGEAEPLDGATDPANVWPVVEAYLPSNLNVAVARIVLSSRKTREFKATFTAMQPFDGLRLRAIGDFGQETPLWTVDFNPVKTGRQILSLRGIRLAPQRKILPGLIDSLNAPPGPKKNTNPQAGR